MAGALTHRRRTVFRCSSCGDSAPKWAGQCASCGEWNTLVEEPADLPAAATRVAVVAARPITEVAVDEAVPIPTGIAEVDRVLGGGLVGGSVTLIGGEPGVGKSTLLLQILAAPAAAGRDVLYMTAEESTQQIRRRAERLGALEPHLYLAAETSVSGILEHIAAVAPSIVVVDSIQTVHDDELGSAPGSVAQVRQCAHRLVTIAKQQGISVVLVGHVTKDGGLAGPRVLEHVVDTVLSFEGDRHHSLRMLRATKHRFGSTQELGLLDMADGGLVAVADPSGLFLADRRTGVPGSTVVPAIDGRRPLLVELQALVQDAGGSPARRNSQGVDQGRVAMLLAVLARRLRLGTGQLDVFTMASGGARVLEPGADLPLALVIVSSAIDKAIPGDVVACGEVGLGGELRAVHGMEARLLEAARLGFRRAVVPRSTQELDVGLEVMRVPSLLAAVELLDLHPDTPPTTPVRPVAAPLR